ncbi:phosphotransferase enzyme family protein [Fredinandcohnia humi]
MNNITLDEDRILQIISQKYPVTIEKVVKVTNEMFLCCGSHGNFYARISNETSYEAQCEEIKWMTFLLENGVNVAPVISSYEGKLVERSILASTKNIVLYKEAPGRHLSSTDWNASFLKILGREIGKLHKISKQYKQPILYLKNWYENEEYQFLKYIPEEESIIRDVTQIITKKINEIPRTENTYGLLHGDVWLENVLVLDNMVPTIIDFQNCEKHYFVYDLAVPLYSALEFTFRGNGNLLDYQRSITEALLEGYSEESTISSEMCKLLPLFMKLKEVFEYSLMHMYWPQEKQREEHIRIMNLYRQRLENFDISNLLI